MSSVVVVEVVVVLAAACIRETIFSFTVEETTEKHTDDERKKKKDPCEKKLNTLTREANRKPDSATSANENEMNQGNEEDCGGKIFTNNYSAAFLTFFPNFHFR